MILSRLEKSPRASKNKLKQLGVNPALIRKIAIASYEAEINMIIHSLGGHMQLGYRRRFHYDHMRRYRAGNTGYRSCYAGRIFDRIGYGA